MNQFYIKDIENLFEENFFLEKGIKEEKKKNKHLEDLANDLFYLNQNITSIIMPYVVKLEAQIKSLTGKNDFKQAIIEISKNPEKYLAQNKSWVFIYDPRTLSNNNDVYTDFIQLLELHRFSRNKLMHAEAWLGRKLDVDEEAKLIKGSMINEVWLPENLKILFANENFNFMNSKSSISQPSFIVITILILSFFNHKKIMTKLTADIDFELFKFISSRQISSRAKFYDWIGLKDDWVKKLIK